MFCIILILKLCWNVTLKCCYEHFTGPGRRYLGLGLHHLSLFLYSVAGVKGKMQRWNFQCSTQPHSQFVTFYHKKLLFWGHGWENMEKLPKKLSFDGCNKHDRFAQDFGVSRMIFFKNMGFLHFREAISSSRGRGGGLQIRLWNTAYSTGGKGAEWIRYVSAAYVNLCDFGPGTYIVCSTLYTLKTLILAKWSAHPLTKTNPCWSAHPLTETNRCQVHWLFPPMT